MYPCRSLEPKSNLGAMTVYNNIQTSQLWSKCFQNIFCGAAVNKYGKQNKIPKSRLRRSFVPLILEEALNMVLDFQLDFNYGKKDFVKAPLWPLWRWLKLSRGPLRGFKMRIHVFFSQLVRRQYFNEENLFLFCQKNVTSEQRANRVADRSQWIEIILWRRSRN